MDYESLAERKATLRASARAARRLAAQTTPGAGRIAAAHALPEIARNRGVKAVSAYVAFRDEIDPLPLMHLLHGLGIAVGLPVAAEPAQPLRFLHWQPGARMQRGAHGVMVPQDGTPLEPEVLVVPLLAFDARGHRLGYGGGYYDRTIADRRARGPILTIGFAFAAQEVEDLPNDAYDMPLDLVATERGVIVAGSGASSRVRA
jgi:5-formyltetrahydrofolate cyclo-ligase